ncbi:MAG TPA: hypothetical protein VJQ85_09280 [Gaiellaceae bacterium]|nr:hypothetical protein [Gaiellaceae bacterium]
MDDWPASENVRAAMQLEVTMRVLDAVDELRRDVDALRAEVPARRTTSSLGAVARVAVESGILIAVAVVAGAGNFKPLLTVALMAVALVCVVLSEWLASRSAYVPRSFGFAQARQPVVYDPPAESSLESDGWERGFFPETEPARL